MRSRTANSTSPATSKICSRFMICERWVFHGLDAQAQAQGDLPGGFAAHDQPQDFQLTGRQVVVLLRWRRLLLSPGQGLVDHRVGDGRAQVAFIVAQGLEGVLEFCGGGVLEQVAVGAAFQGLHDQGRVGVHRQDQHLALRVERLEPAQGVEAAGVFHRQVQQDDVRMQPFDHFQQERAVIRFTDHRVSGNVHDQGTHASPDERVVIHQE